MMINSLIKFHELWIKTVPFREYTRFFLSFDLATNFSTQHDPVYKLDLNIMMIDILTKFHERWIKTVHCRVNTKFF